MLKRLNLNDDARDVLVEATRAEPCHWGAWLELSGHISERGELAALQGPKSMEISFMEFFLHNNACYYFSYENVKMWEVLVISLMISY